MYGYDHDGLNPCPLPHRTYAALAGPHHLGTVAPLPALVAAAGATERPRLGADPGRTVRACRRRVGPTADRRPPSTRTRRPSRMPGRGLGRVAGAADRRELDEWVAPLPRRVRGPCDGCARSPYDGNPLTAPASRDPMIR